MICQGRGEFRGSLRAHVIYGPSCQLRNPTALERLRYLLIGRRPLHQSIRIRLVCGVDDMVVMDTGGAEPLLLLLLLVFASCFRLIRRDAIASSISNSIFILSWGMVGEDHLKI